MEGAYLLIFILGVLSLHFWVSLLPLVFIKQKQHYITSYEELRSHFYSNQIYLEEDQSSFQEMLNEFCPHLHPMGLLWE